MAHSAAIARLVAARARREHDGLLRRLRTVEHADGGHVVLDGRRLLNFSGNDYLGLAGHPALVAALRDAAAEHGVGATAAHLVCGHRRPHAELEAALAEWTGREAALLFSTGWMANLGVLQALLGPGDLCVQDRLNHASLLDGARLAGCTLRRYRHGDVEAAGRQLRQAGPGAAGVLATDGVFSMDGDVAPLSALARCAAAVDATLLVDDAHGLGVLGPEGAGSVAAAGLGSAAVPVLMATLGKALGTCGAFVAGDRALIEGLVQSARTFVYTTALPPALAAATLAAVGIARREHWRREHLTGLVAHFRAGAIRLGLRLADSPTPIQPLLVGSAEDASALAAALEARGVLAVAIRPPTVPVGSARLRITLTASHARADVDQLLAALAQVLEAPRPA
ncbi:MAG: 8-amino-7-oxononanoate synthase [Xanthomonadales bacterium]|nr:8-amino-7-oxononanoate synthase [Xanthomonadales bacterium]